MPLHSTTCSVKSSNLRGLADGGMGDRQQTTIGRRPYLQTLQRARAVAEREHLLPGQRHTHRALERAAPPSPPVRQLILRAQARAERAADISRENSDLLFLESKDLLHIGLTVLRALGLVVDVQAAIGLIQHRAGMRLHRIVMLDRRAVVQVQADGRAGKFRLKIPTGLGQFGGGLRGLRLAGVSRSV